MRFAAPVRIVRPLFLALALSILGFSTSVQAADFNYLNENSVAWKKLLPPPPSANSDEQRAELELLRTLQTTRTEAQVAQAQADAKVGLASFQQVFGDWFTAENLPKLNELAKKTVKDAKAVAEVSKEHFGRLRPAIAKAAVENDAKHAYPSAHSTYGTALAVVLCELCPEQKDALLERSREIGWDREVLGLHFPSDVVAGRVLGQAVGQALLADEKFRQDFSAAKAEFDAVRASQNGKSADKKPAPVGAN